MSNILSLNKSHFEHHAVWTWADDVSYEPVAAQSPLPSDRGILLIRAKLFPPAASALEGYIIWNGTVYALCVLVDDREFVFNRHMQNEDAAQVASWLFGALGRPPFTIFPLRYETDFTDESGAELRGTFTIDSGYCGGLH